jgi:archaellum component FlaC
MKLNRPQELDQLNQRIEGYMTEKEKLAQEINFINAKLAQKESLTKELQETLLREKYVF